MNPLTQNKTTNFVITRHSTEKYTSWPPTRTTSRKRHAQTTKAKQTFEGTELRNPSVERHPTIQQKCGMYHFNFMPAKTLASSIRVQFKMHSLELRCILSAHSAALVHKLSASEFKVQIAKGNIVPV